MSDLYGIRKDGDASPRPYWERDANDDDKIGLPAPPSKTERGRPMSDLYWIKKNGDASGPFTFRQVQSMWHAGTVKVTDEIRRDGKSEWHSISEVRRHLERGGGQMTVGKIVLAIVLAILILVLLGLII